MRRPRPSHPPPPSCLAPSWTPCTDRSYTHAKPLLRAQTTRAERPHHSTKQHTHTLTHTHKATPTTHTLHIQYRGGGRGYTIYDALADHPDDPADASAQGVPAGRGYTAPGRQGHPASGPGTVHASHAQPGPLAGWCAPCHPPRRPHRRSRDPCCLPVARARARAGQGGRQAGHPVHHHHQHHADWSHGVVARAMALRHPPHRDHPGHPAHAPSLAAPPAHVAVGAQLGTPTRPQPHHLYLAAVHSSEAMQQGPGALAGTPHH